MSMQQALRWAGVVAFAVGIGAAFLFRDRLDLEFLATLVGELGNWGAAVFVLLFAVGAVLFLPGAMFGLAGGALFGPLWGTVLNVVGGSTGAAFAFLIARYLASDWVRRRAGGRLNEIITGVETDGWRFVAFVRLVPVFPFNVSNYAFGLTRIPLSQYLAATVICMIPGSAAFAWLGHAGASATAGEKEAIWYGLLGLAALATIAFLPRLFNRLRGRVASKSQWVEAAEIVAVLRGSGDLAIVDVREGDEFVGVLGHIPGAANIPLGAIVADPNQLARVKDRLVVLVCRTDRRSARAAEALRGVGLSKVSVLRGGMERWNALGLPIERETQAATHANAVHSE